MTSSDNLQIERSGKGLSMSSEPSAIQSDSQLAADEIRKANPSPTAVKTFAGGIGCAAIVAALIYSKRHKRDDLLGHGN